MRYRTVASLELALRSLHHTGWQPVGTQASVPAAFRSSRNQHSCRSSWRRWGQCTNRQPARNFALPVGARATAARRVRLWIQPVASRCTARAAAPTRRVRSGLSTQGLLRMDPSCATPPRPCPIRPLPPASVAGLRSSTAITCMAQCIEELVANSIDAGATVIDVSVRVEEGFATVSDNGRGMDAGDFAVVGERYSTSKIRGLEDLATASTLGYRGEALASLGEIAILSLHTQAASNCGCALEKWIQAGTTMSLGKSARARQVGTTVTVRDLFGNYPVRRKALLLEARKELQRVKQLLIRFALAHCTLCFSLYDSQRGSTMLQTQAVPDALSCFGHLFGPSQASKLVTFDSLASPNGAGQRRSDKHGTASSDTPKFRLRGYMSKPGSQGYHTKELQYLYVHSDNTRLHAADSRTLSLTRLSVHRRRFVNRR